MLMVEVPDRLTVTEQADGHHETIGPAVLLMAGVRAPICGADRSGRGKSSSASATITVHPGAILLTASALTVAERRDTNPEGCPNAHSRAGPVTALSGAVLVFSNYY